MKKKTHPARPELVEGRTWFDKLTMSGYQKRTMSGYFFAIVVIASVSEAIQTAYAAPDVAAIEKTYQNLSTLKTDFVQSTLVTLLEKTVTKSGRIFYKKGGKLRIEYAGDRMMHYIVNSPNVWMVDPILKEIKIYSIENSGAPQEALDFLANLGNLSTYFDVSYDKKDRLVLKPKSKTSYKALYCQFNEENLLKSFSIVSKTGNSTDYRLFNIQTDVALSDKLFTP